MREFFSTHRTLVIGSLGVALVAALVVGILVVNKSLFEGGYTIKARFSSAAGIGPGAKVLLAGVPVGSVKSERLDGNSVLLSMHIRSGVTLPHRTSASIEVETLLGVEDVTLVPRSGWSHPLGNNAVITNTTIPVQIYQLETSTGDLLDQINTKAVDQLLSSLAKDTSGERSQLIGIINGLTKLTKTVNQRSLQVSSLISASRKLSHTLAERDQEITGVIDNLNTVVDSLAQRSGEVAAMIDEVESAAAQLSKLVGDNQPTLDHLLGHLHAVLSVLNQHQEDLAEVVSYLAASLQGFSSVGVSGPEDAPTPWANIYVNPLGLTSTYGLLAPCGLFSHIMRAVFGPDPLACSQRTGPLPQPSPGTPSETMGPEGLDAVFQPLLSTGVAHG
jgi:phospholipid/cholesterol/gamma-HCH transport system substrate-binding protein